MTTIQSGVSATDLATVDNVSKAVRAALYDASAGTPNPLAPAGRANVPALQGGLIVGGVDYRAARPLRADETGGIALGNPGIFLYDSSEGAAVNTNTWIQTTTTMTITQAAATGVLLNAGSSVAATVGAMHTSHRHMPKMIGAPMLLRARARATGHFSGNLHEIGFGTPASATAAAIGNGACWRKDSTGQWLPVVSINGTEILGTAISNATFIASVPATDYAIFVVEIKHSVFRFAIYTQAGVLVTSQDINLSDGSSLPGFAVTHLQAFYRTYNASAPGTAVQLFVDEISVFGLDAFTSRDYATALSGMGFNSTQSPTAFTQLANWTNNTAPTTRTLSNTAAAETTLGGLLRVNSIAGGNNDLIMFGWQNPSPYTFYFTGLRIPVPINEVVIVATTETIFVYSMAFNSSAVSLATTAPYAPRFVGLGGLHRAAIALAVNGSFTGADLIWQPRTPIAVMPGRFLHVNCRELVGTATATETYLWPGVEIDGFFE